ncbi:hypothetical protein bcCo53_001192 (plasmid) [Borrelia coriaceae]|uniref:Uncharacterized protein n=1 Tax=Borrelia coriaceae ATCC 43381 TaxID=1408429 RepID=W5SV52_9SPIR|nr:hypothetical protein [Borrelia coriaceae]AHH11099.1 hypothetical protein BCO_0000601 [Borrelia coriaceae ATCC 43381]UPA17023.1 hypothetical protein bcCo53_001192 [Borrelia coriaceae]
MRVRKSFLKLFFLFALLIPFKGCKTLESEELTVGSYFSNYNRSGDLTLRLKNNDNEFVIFYVQYPHEVVNIYLTLKNERKIVVKSIKLNGDDVHLYSGYLSVLLNDVENVEYQLDLKNYKTRWKKLIEEAKGGPLKFSVLIMQTETGIEKTYEFKASAANLSLLAEMIDIV